MFNQSGGYDEEATPVPIPNTVVKLFGADNTWLETAWEDRALPDTTEKGEVYPLLFLCC